MKKIQEKNIRFRDAVTNIAFSLTLSRRQCEILGWIYNKADPGGREYSHFLNTALSLIGKGLVYHRQTFKNDGKVDTRFPAYHLTQEGESVCQLLLSAELLTPAVNKKAA